MYSLLYWRSSLLHAISHVCTQCMIISQPLRSDQNSFHTVMSHSSRWFHIGIQLDFEGVLLLMWGATVPLIYYGFYCDEKLQRVYWGLLSGFAIAASIFTFQPRFRDPHLRPLRAATFGSFAFSSIIPMVHAVVKYGWATQSRRMGLYWVIGVLCFNTAGATAYAVKVGP